MYHIVAKRVGLAPGESMFSSPIPIGDYNSVRLDMLVFAGEVRAYLQETDNEQDWVVKDTYSPVDGPAHTMQDAAVVKRAFVRVRFEEATGTNPAVFGGGVNLSKQ